MPVFKEHAPGTLSYIELVSPDPDGSKDFYMNLLGWEVRDEDLGPHGIYTQFLKAGEVVGALYKLMPEQQEAQVPPHWGLYLTVTDAAAAAAKAEELGGKVVMGPMDVFTHGKMCVLTDPVGAAFCVWQPLDHIGLGCKNEHGALCWAEHMTSDVGKSQSFYETFFGWVTTGMDMGEMGTYHMMGKTEEEPCCGMMAIAPEMGPVPPHWLPYLQVDDLDAINSKAEELGGKVAVPATEVPGGGKFSVVQDPQNAYMGFYQVGQEKCD